ncbi:MAG: response regulator [Proteobacteria bacterium]|nr:response regulator [Pseudomonadota bacterium]
MSKQIDSQKEATDKSPLRILLIEDSDVDAYIIEKSLRTYMPQAQYLRAATLKSGEDILQEGATDVVLLDLGLPDTASPADTYAHIKKWTDQIPVVIMTNLKDHALAKVMVHDGAADFINKDVIGKNPRLIQSAIDFSVERHASHKQLKSEKERAVKDSKEKDSILSCFMGGYSIGGGGK